MWGFGGLADNYMFNVFNVLFLFVYVNYFGMDPKLAGIAVAIPRFFDAITDPMVGNFSDNFVSRWGRRRPLIAFGVIASAILLPLHWLPPVLKSVGNPWYCNGPFIFISVLGCIYALTYTFFVVPFTALGFELTDDYDEKTSVLAWRMYLGLLGQSIVPWIYKVSVNEKLFDNIQDGAVVTSIVMAIVIIICGFLPIIGCKEKPEFTKERKVEKKEDGQNMLMASLSTFKNKSFVIVVIGFFLILMCLGACGTIGGFLNLYIVCNGNEAQNATLSGTSGTMISLICYLSIFLLSFLSRLKGKREAFMAGMVIGFIGWGTLYFTLTPKHPYLQLTSIAVYALAMQGCWLLLDSMMADICDDDELNTGKRREGLFGAVRGFIQKGANSLVSVISGFALTYSGFVLDEAKTVGISAEVAQRMKLMYVTVPLLGFALGFIIFIFYPISRKRSEETRRILAERHAAEANNR